MNLNFFQDSNFKTLLFQGLALTAHLVYSCVKELSRIFFNLCKKKEARRPLFLFKQFRLFFFVFIVAFDSNGIECRYFIVAFQFLDLDA